MSWVGLLINSAIGGAIGGLILAKLFKYIQAINTKFFRGWFNNLFRLYFWPMVVWAIIGGWTGSTLFAPGIFIVMLVGNIAGTYVYATIMEKKLGSYYDQDLSA